MKIKYDLKEAKSYAILAVSFGIIFALGIADMFVEIGGTELFALFAFYLGGVAFVYCLYRSFSAYLYLEMLKRYGYEIPADKKEYEGRLDLLPKDDAIYEEALGDQSRKSKTSMTNAILFGIAFIVFVCFDVFFYKKWQFMAGNARTVAFFFVIFDLFWAIGVVYYFQQTNRKKYRDLAEIDEKRKPRTTLPRGILNVCILAGITFLVKTTGGDMIDYVFHACEQQDQTLICDLQNAVQIRYEEQYGLCESVQQALADGFVIEEGVSLQSMEEEDALFWEQVLEEFSAEDFDVLLARIHVTKETAQIKVWLDDDTIVVKLLNTVDMVKKWPMKSTGLDSERPAYVQ